MINDFLDSTISFLTRFKISSTEKHFYLLLPIKCHKTLFLTQQLTFSSEVSDCSKQQSSKHISELSRTLSIGKDRQISHGKKLYNLNQ